VTEKEWRQETKSLNRKLGKEYELFTAVGLRADYKCEYCGIDVLSSAQAYRGAAWDHILPRECYGHLDTFANKALVCASCHSLKGRIDPGETGRDSWKDKDDLTDEERAMLIQRVRALLEPMRQKQDAAIQAAQRLLRSAGP